MQTVRNRQECLSWVSTTSSHAFISTAPRPESSTMGREDTPTLGSGNSTSWRQAVPVSRRKETPGRRVRTDPSSGPSATGLSEPIDADGVPPIIQGCKKWMCFHSLACFAFRWSFDHYSRPEFFLPRLVLAGIAGSDATGNFQLISPPTLGHICRA